MPTRPFSAACSMKKIPMYDAVNTLQGYREIAIYSPLEVVEYEHQDV
jgi:hypothetical protein